MDLLTAMTRPELPLTAHEYGEWGDVRSDAAVLAAVRPRSSPRGTADARDADALLCSQFLVSSYDLGQGVCWISTCSNGSG